MSEYKINIPGSPGTAMAIASSVSIYSAAIVSDAFKIHFLFVTFLFLLTTIIIEVIHNPEKIRECLKKET